MPRIHKMIEQHCQKYIDKFESHLSNVTWAASGILTSEGLALCALCDLFKVDILIESGVFHGRSTQIWAECLPNIQIYATDIRVQAKAKERLSKYSNVELKQGKGEVVIPALVQQNKDKRIGVFLDGPKGKPAIAIADKVLNEPHVAFAGIHDMHMLGRNGMKPGTERTKSTSRIAFDDWKRDKFATDTQWFVEEYKHLDVNDSQYDPKQDIRWTPYVYVNKHNKPKRKLGSYGPTIGFAFNNGYSI